MQEIIVGGTYKHYKGDLYKVIALGKHSETLEDMVIYIGLYEPKKEVNYNSIRIRPKELFVDEVTRNGEIVPHFTLMNS